jgi:hypothetical protein
MQFLILCWTWFTSTFWPYGAISILAGLFVAEFIGYWYHRVFQHAVIRVIRSEAHRRSPIVRYLFVPWKAAYYMHMWHHYTLYPEPNAPGTKPKPFRTKKDYYYYGQDLPQNPLGIVNPSDNPRLDKFLHTFYLDSNFDWMMTGLVVLGVGLVFLSGSNIWYYAFGFSIAAFLNHFVHDSFHVKPYARLKLVPLKAWMHPAVFFANVGEHVPGFRAYYQWMFRWHIAHHYEVLKMQGSNVRYHGEVLNAGYTNFTIYNPIWDVIFGTASYKKFKETK